MRIAILGSGAMGALFGGLLARDGESVVLIDVWEEHVSAIEENGLTIETATGESHTIPVEATTSPETVGDVDLVCVFVKSTQTDEAARQANNLLDDAEVLTLQNGLGNPDTLRQYVDANAIIAGVTAHGSTLLEPGKIRHTGEGPTSIGRYFDENSEGVVEIADVFTHAGIETVVAEDVRTDIWEKVLVNVGINAATALGRVENGKVSSTDPGRALVVDSVTEARTVAEAHGIDIRDDIIEHVFEVAELTGSNRSSMLQDIEAGRRTEIESLHGEVVRIARDHDIETPINTVLANLVRLASPSDL